MLSCHHWRELTYPISRIIRSSYDETPKGGHETADVVLGIIPSLPGADRSLRRVNSNIDWILQFQSPFRRGGHRCPTIRVNCVKQVVAMLFVFRVFHKCATDNGYISTPPTSPRRLPLYVL